MARTTTKTVVFLPLGLEVWTGFCRLGSYAVETDEELIPGLSFLAYRRVRTTIILPIRTTARQVVTIDPQDLEAALVSDARPAADRDDVAVVQEPVEDGGRNHGFTEHGARFANLAVLK